MTKISKPRRMARSPEATAIPSPAAPKRAAKQDLVLELLKREGGAPLGVIVDATGWLPHTVRAALTGLRKRGHKVSRSKIGDETRYSVASVATQ